MPNLRIGYVNYWPTGTITASSSVSALPSSASQNANRDHVWRSTTSTGTATLDIDLATSRAVTMCALANVKLVGTGVVRLYSRGTGGSPGAATLIATFASSNVETLTTIAMFTSVSARHWQLEWTNPTAASDYAELGFAYLGPFVEPSLNVMPDWTTTRVDPSASRVSLGNQKNFATRAMFFRGEFMWEKMPSADFDMVAAVWHAVGRVTPIVLSLDTTVAWTTWFARVLDSPLRKHRLNVRRHDVTLPWEELR